MTVIKHNGCVPERCLSFSVKYRFVLRKHLNISMLMDSWHFSYIYVLGYCLWGDSMCLMAHDNRRDVFSLTSLFFKVLIILFKSESHKRSHYLRFCPQY